jgi:teichuronic acid exporter
MSLQKRAFSGLFWAFLEQFSLQGINFLISIILARILLPEEFGVIGMISVLLAIGVALKESGVMTSLIRTIDPDEYDYSTVFYTNLFASLFIYSLLFITAPAVAAFFDKPELINITRVLTLKIVINAFVSIQNTRLVKAMNFKKQLLMHLPAIILGGIAGVVLAQKGFGVWSLVYMTLLQEVFAALFLWLSSDWYPRLIFSKAKFKIHFFFGYKIALSNLVNALYDNIYNIIIGKYFSAQQLGYYTRAYTTRQIPIANISAVLNKVTYPMFAEIQNDTVKFKKVYKLLMQQVVFFISPIMIIAWIIAEPLFLFLFTEKWLPAVPYFQVLCLASILYPVNNYNLNVLTVKGRSDLLLRLEIIKKTLIGIGIFIIIPFGIMALLWFQVATTMVVFFINTYYSGQLINYPTSEQLKDIVPILLLSFVMGVICYGASFLFAGVFSSELVILTLITVIGLTSYLLLALLFRMSAILEIRSLLLKFLNK